MSIGNKPVYPILLDTTPNYDRDIEVGEIFNITATAEQQVLRMDGLTYREWLIGMALSNTQIISFLETATYDQNIEVNTKAIFDSVDAIIKQLDKEKE